MYFDIWNNQPKKSNDFTLKSFLHLIFWQEKEYREFDHILS